MLQKTGNPTTAGPKFNPTQLSPNDTRITKDELRSILKAADREGFDKIIDDYTKEISNPDNIVETNEYLRQAQEANDLPKNVKLAQPSKGFCIKSEKFSIKRPGIRHKAYINICSYEGVKPPSEDPYNRGMWSLPHLLNKSRNDQDKKGNLCYTFDVIFNTLAIKMGRENFSFKKFICDTSINGINSNLLKAAQEKISNDYVLKSKYEYKGKEVAYVNIHSLSVSELDNRAENNENYKTNVQKEIDDLKLKDEGKNKTSEEDEDTGVFDKPDVNIEQSQKDVQSSESEIKFPIAPKYKIKYSDNFEMQKFFYQPNVNTEDAQYKKLIVDIEVPLIDNLSCAELELDNKILKLKFKEIYDLNIDLPVDIDKERSDAKFDRKKSLLTISAMIVRRNKEVLKLKEDENIEIVKDEEEGKEINKNEITENSGNSKIIETQVKKQKEEERADTQVDSQVDKQISTDVNNKQNKNRELLEINSPVKNEISINPKIEEETNLSVKKENVKEIVKEVKEIRDEDDIENNMHENMPQVDDQSANKMSNSDEELIKISYMNFNCDIVYEID